MPIEKHYTPREAAPLLHLDEKYVREQVKAGKVGAVLRGRRMLIPESAIVAYWASLPPVVPPPKPLPAALPPRRSRPPRPTGRWF